MGCIWSEIPDGVNLVYGGVMPGKKKLEFIWIVTDGMS
jgi:hypothetical protein